MVSRQEGELFQKQGLSGDGRTGKSFENSPALSGPTETSDFRLFSSPMQGPAARPNAALSAFSPFIAMLLAVNNITH